MSFVYVGMGFMAFLSATTLAIDVGMFMTARSQAQNSADAGALAGAVALVQPSRLESLGIVLFEAWQYGTPVLVHRANLVTSGQTERAHAGRSYADDGFGAALEALTSERDARGADGQEYVARECSYAAFDERLERLVEATAP